MNTTARILKPRERSRKTIEHSPFRGTLLNQHSSDRSDMRMIHTYEEFCLEHDKNNIRPDVWGPEAFSSIERLRNHGWKIRFLRAKRDLLALCRYSPENFTLAHREGIDFWIKDEA